MMHMRQWLFGAVCVALAAMVLAALTMCYELRDADLVIFKRIRAAESMVAEISVKISEMEEQLSGLKCRLDEIYLEQLPLDETLGSSTVAVTNHVEEAQASLLAEALVPVRGGYPFLSLDELTARERAQARHAAVVVEAPDGKIGILMAVGFDGKALAIDPEHHETLRELALDYLELAEILRDVLDELIAKNEYRFVKNLDESKAYTDEFDLKYELKHGRRHRGWYYEKLAEGYALIDADDVARSGGLSRLRERMREFNRTLLARRSGIISMNWLDRENESE